MGKNVEQNTDTNCVGNDSCVSSSVSSPGENISSHIVDHLHGDDVPLKFDASKTVRITPITSPKLNAKRPQKLKTPADDDKDWELVPPDGGWGWLVLGGSMLVNLLVPGTVKSFGVLFMEFLEAFDASPSTALWIPALCYFLYSSLGPLSSILSVKYSYRTVTLIGGTFAAVGMMVSYFASSVTFLYISYGVLVGIGAGLSFPPTVYIVTSYFVRYRGLANGICISGSAFGSIILPPILRYLLVEYGYRGAILIMGAITLNTWVAALFYEPVENHMKRVPKEPIDPLDDFNDVIDEEDEGITLEFAKQPENGLDDGHTKPTFEITSDELPATPKSRMTSPDAFKQHRNGEQFARSASAVAVQNFTKGAHDESTHHRQRKISTPVRGSHAANDSFVGQLSSTPSLYAVPESRFSHSSRLSRLNQYRSSGRPPKRSPSTSSFQYVSTPYHGSTLSFQPEEFASHLSLKSIANSMNPISACTKSKVKTKSKFLDLSLLKDPAYLVILISNSTNAIGYTNFIILLPTYATKLGFDKDYSAYLLSIVSALDLIGRIGGSALSDTGFIPKTWYFVGGLALSGISLALMPFATSYKMVSFWCAMFGLASGTYVGITAVIMADMLGTERLTSSYGISLFVNGVLQLIGPPLCGIWFERTQSYSSLFSTLGLTLLTGSSLWGFMPFINRNRKRKEEERLQKIAEENEEELM